MRSMSYKQSTANTNASISPAIWGDLPIEDWALGYGGMFQFDDFQNLSKYTATGAVASNAGYAAFTTGATEIIQPSATATDLNGVASMVTTATTAKECYFGTQAGIGFECLSPTSVNAGKLFAFECRVSFTVIASTNQGVFIGLGDPALSITTGTITTTTGIPISTGNFIGFNSRMDAAASVNCVYQAASQTLQTPNLAVVTPVAATYMKLGFRWSPGGNGYTPARSLKYFVNGVEQATAVSNTNIAAATFPSNVVLSRLAALKTGSSTAGGFKIDWWAFAQQRA